jgi:hypothetical protein
MTARRRNIAALVTAAVVSAGLPAAAADDLVVIEAKQRMAEGKDLYGAGQYEAAWLKYKQACVVLKSDNCTRGLAFTEFKSKRWLDAYQHMRELLLPAPKPSLTPPMVDELSRMMREAYAKTGHIGVRADPGATLALDGSPLLVSPSDALDVLPGKHVVEASHLGRTRRLEVNAAEGTVVDADLTIPSATEPIAGVPVSAPGSTPDLAGPGGVGPDGGPQKTDSTFWNGHRTAGAIVGGVGVASLSAAIAFQAARTNDASNAASIRASLPPGACSGGGSSRCQALDSAYNAQTRDADLSTAFLVVGGVALAGGAALLLWPASTSSHVSLVPMMSPRSAGLELRGGW